MERRNMGTTSAQPRKEAESAAAALSGAERRAVDCFERLEKAERSFDEGMQFGQAVIDLRDEIKANHRRNFKARLEELGITYAKARYWMAIAEGREINRGTAKEKAASTSAPDWDAATDRFEKLSGVIADLYHSQPDGSEGLIEVLHDLADELGYELVKKGGVNA
jgi:hypothetical protein